MPKLSCALHKCCQFSQDPKASNECAVLNIVQYLKFTQHMGFIMKPTSTCLVDCYCDSNLLSVGVMQILWIQLPSFLIPVLSSCLWAVPLLIWSSNLQKTKTTISTYEAEFVSLSTSLCQVVPLTALLEGLCCGLCSMYLKPNIHCTFLKIKPLEMAIVPNCGLAQSMLIYAPNLLHPTINFNISLAKSPVGNYILRGSPLGPLCSLPLQYLLLSQICCHLYSKVS